VADPSPREVAELTSAAADFLATGVRDLDRAWGRLEDAGWPIAADLHRLADEAAAIAARVRQHRSEADHAIGRGPAPR
jgi:hypothetical protein